MAADLHCPKCLCSMTGDVVGAACRVTPGCAGIIEEQPAFDTLVDVLPEPMTCGRRAESGMDAENSTFKGPFKSGKGLDRWQKFKSNGNRVCSYCGSLHPEDLFELVRQSANAPEDAEYRDVVEIERSDKNYKLYVHQPGVRNAHEGGIKFYMQHLPRDYEFYMQHLPRDHDGKLAVTDQDNREYAQALTRSMKRFDRMLAMMKKPASARPQ